MESERSPSLPRRTVLRGTVFAALTALGAGLPRPARAAADDASTVGEGPQPPSYEVIVGLL